MSTTRGEHNSLELCMTKKQCCERRAREHNSFELRTMKRCYVNAEVLLEESSLFFHPTSVIRFSDERLSRTREYIPRYCVHEETNV